MDVLFLLSLMFQRVDRCLPYSTKADSGDHIGSPLRMSVLKYGFPSAPAASEHALFSSLFLAEKHRFFGGSSYIPQKQSFCGNPSAFCGKEETPAPKAKVFHRKTEQLHRAPTMSAAIGIMFFHSVHSRIGSRLSLAHWVKRHACALDETSCFRATT